MWCNQIRYAVSFKKKSETIVKIYEFLCLKEQERYQAVWDNGRHIDTKAKDGIIYQLYALNDFFVEIHYNQENNEIIGNLPFKQGEHLEKYLP